MIISPRAKPVIDVVRKEGNGFIKVDEVFLYRRTGGLHRKIPYWKRGEDSDAPPPPKLTSFAIVPEMTAAVTKGHAVYAADAWRAFDRQMQTSGSFGTQAVVSFPEPRLVQGWSLQFEYAWSSFWLAIEGKLHDGAWHRIFESSSTSPVNYGRFGATATPMLCTAVRLLTDYSSSPVRSCQFFDCVPLVPVTMQWNSTLANAGVELVAEPINYNLHRCFTEQSNAYTHGTAAWYFNGGEWRSNRGLAGTRDQNRFVIRFTEPKTVDGFSVGGIFDEYYYDDYYFGQNCYANCLLIEGRESDADFWRPLAEVEFEPSERRTRYFDFPVSRLVSQLRITVQEVTHGTGASDSAAVYLPPMQVYGT